mmetsp:Transcript_2855/g.4076  ORF Transcript_2855/g.4076 Transcript_2855/m.4076 type:complete len:312 (+) Transcript_2855:177-1112(+)
MLCCSSNNLDNIGIDSRKEYEDKAFERKKPARGLDVSVRFGAFKRGMSFKKNPKSKVKKNFQIFGSCDILQSQAVHLLGLILPYEVKNHNWVQQYSLLQHGAYLQTVLEKCAGLSPTLMIIHTKDGEIFGAYCTTPWSQQANYYGNGDCWVYKMKPQKNDNKRDAFQKAKSGRGLGISARFRAGSQNNFDLSCQGGTRASKEGQAWSTNKYVWTGKNHFHQYSNQENLGMGGGGSFAFVLDDNLQTGVAGISETYDNEMLYEKNGGKFDVKNVEIWSFSLQPTDADARREIANLRIRKNSDVSYGAGVSSH